MTYKVFDGTLNLTQFIQLKPLLVMYFIYVFVTTFLFSSYNFLTLFDVQRFKFPLQDKVIWFPWERNILRIAKSTDVVRLRHSSDVHQVWSSVGALFFIPSTSQAENHWRWARVNYLWCPFSFSFLCRCFHKQDLRRLNYVNTVIFISELFTGEDCRIGPPPKVHLSVSIPCKKG